MVEFSKNLAVVIGINDYSNGISPLVTAVNDATKLNEILRLDHGYQPWIFLDRMATLANITHLLEETLPQQVTCDDRLLFYFAGHGIALNGEEGPEGYLIPQDARLGDVSTYFSMVRLNHLLNQLPCRHFLGILDCCFAGAFRWSSTRHIAAIPNIIHQERFDRFLADPAWQVITSAAYDQKALDALSLTQAGDRGQVGQNSPFAAALIEALQGQADAYPPAHNGKPAGDGAIAATELYLYLRDRVEQLTQANHQRQTPGIWFLNKHDKGEYIFLNPNHPLNLPPAPPLDPSQNPYRGLESFEEEHSALFFGRSALIEKLSKVVSHQTLTVVLGASGSGKSSLVKAGLIPYLKQVNQETTPQTVAQGTQRWQIVLPFRPGESPLKSLNNALMGEIISNQKHNAIALMTDYLATWEQNHPHTKLLLVIDQLEELITLAQDEEERQIFLQVLANAIDAYPQCLRVVLTLRSDFEPQFQETALQPYWQEARLIVPPMSRSQLREAIEEPASQRVMYFQSDDPKSPLLDRIIDEVADMPGALPLLSFTLSELYLKYLQRQQAARNRGDTIDRAITEADYQELGGVARSLTQRADIEYQALVAQDRGYESIIPSVMLRMVALSGGDLARRRVPLAEFEYPPDKNKQVKEVIRCFSAARLLVEGRDLDGNPYVEPAHDALVRGWQRLLLWKQAAAENLMLQRRLTPAAQEWQNLQQQEQPSRFSQLLNHLDRGFYSIEHLINTLPAHLRQLWQQPSKKSDSKRDRPNQFLWNSNPYLDVLNEQLKLNDNEFNQVETEFVRVSVLQKRRNISWRWRLAILVISGLSGLTLIALFNLRNAQIGQAKAARESAQTRLFLNQSLDGILDSLRAGKSLKHPLLQLFAPNTQLQEQVRGTLQKAVYTVREQNRLTGHQGTVRSSFSPDGRLIVSAGDDDIVRLWNQKGQPIAQWKANHGEVMNISFSPKGEQLATAGADNTVRLWNLQGQLLAEFQGHTDLVKGVSFSPDGQYLVTSGRDTTVRLWNLQGQSLAVMQGHTKDVWNVAFSPDGQMIASVAEDDTVRFWDRQGKLLLKFKANQGELHNLKFSPDGQQLATSGNNGTLRLWNLQGKLLADLKGHQGRVWSVVFSADARSLASAAADGTVRLWNLQGQQLLELKGHEGPVRSVNFSPDGQVVNSGGDDGTVRLWNVQEKALAQLQGHQGSVRSVSFSPDGQRLATTGEDGTIRLWNAQGQFLSQFKAHQKPIRNVIFSPDGQTLVSDADNTIRLWNLQGKLLTQFNAYHNLIRTVKFSPDGQRLVSAGDDGMIRLWDLQGQSLAVWQGDRVRVWQVAVSSDGQQLASGGDDGIVRLWNLQGQPMGQLRGHLGPVYSVAFSPDRKQLVSGGQDSTVRLWDLDSKLKIQLFQVYNAEVNSVAFSPDGKMIVSGDDHGNLQLWQLAIEQLFADWVAHQDSILRQVSLSPDGTMIVTAADDGVAKLWQIKSFDALLNHGCSQAQDYLTNNPQLSPGDRDLCDHNEAL